MPNELYVQWLKEWMDKAYDLQSKGYQTLRKAHDSMQACPFDIGHPSQAAQLKGIGPILCARLEKTLTAHCKANNVPMPQRPTNARESDSQEDAPVRKKRAVKPYVPNHGSGPWAILMGLSEPGARENLPKSEVIRLSQPFCSSSFEVASDVRGLYTAWNSMATLIIKELVHKTGNPAKYTLTDAGTEVASRLRAVPHPDVLVRDQTLGIVDLARQDTLVDTQEDDDEGPNSDVELELPPAPDVTTAFEPIVIPRGHFEIQLILDIREVKTQRDRSFIEEQLSQSNIDLRTRALDVGDAMWIAKCRDGGEIVLDHIVERKRMDDLVASIKDGRFHEQKFRLQKCGARHVIYVIEEQNMHEVMSYQEAIQTAISSTQIVTGFFVKRVQSLDYTIRYLVKLTKKLRTLYEVRPTCYPCSKASQPLTTTESRFVHITRPHGRFEDIRSFNDTSPRKSARPEILPDL